jgi:hypothetical protein
MRAARKPSGVARELLRNFPKAGSRRRRRKRKPSQDGKRGKRANGAVASGDGKMDLAGAEDNGGGPADVDEEVAEGVDSDRDAGSAVPGDAAAD